MSNFITVEDVNSTLYKYGSVNTLHSIDTSKMGISEYGNVMYDFCICSHSISGNNHTFTFDVKNDIWCGGYYFTDADGEYIDSNATINDKTITFTTTEEAVILHLYLTNLFTTFKFERLSWISEDLHNLNTFKNQTVNETFTITKLDGTTATGTVLFEYDTYSATSTISDGSVDYQISDGTHDFEGIVKITYDACSYYMKCGFVKDVVPILITDNVIASKVNTVQLTIPTGFTGLENGTVTYKDKVIPVDFENNSFELDLVDKLNRNSVRCSLKVDETDTTMGYTYDFIIPCDFLQVDNASDLVAELSDANGCRVIEIIDDISFNSNILVNHDVKIIGNDCSFNLNNYSIDISEGVSLKAEHLRFSVGNPAIIQRVNSSFSAEHCIFTNCIAENYNNLGSVILCDIDLDSLSVSDDFYTTIKHSQFIDNHSCILQGGELTVDDCTFRNNDLTYVDKNNVAFLYQVDGEALISNSVFDIDYIDESLCTEQKNIGFAQALFKCGLTAQINTATHDYLSENEKALFCEAPFNNVAHLFAKYYYPEIETCVYSSPIETLENKALCYAVSEVNWVFKENVKVTRADAEEENTIRKIEWEDD